MKLFSAALMMSMAAAVGLAAAQSSQTETKQKVSIEDGKDVTVTGCVERASGPRGGFILTHVADKTGERHDYAIVTDKDDFGKFVGQRVTIDGKAADLGDGKVKVERETKTENPDRETKSKSQTEGDLAMPYLGVKSVKMIAATCP
jgi:hypothetical protein